MSSPMFDTSDAQRDRERSRRHYERHGDRRATGASRPNDRIHVRLNANVQELADILLWQETHQGRFSTLAGAVNGMIRLMLNSIRDNDASFRGFSDVDSAQEYLHTYTSGQIAMQFQVTVPQHAKPPKPFTAQQLADFARIDAAAARGFGEDGMVLHSMIPAHHESVTPPDDPDAPLSDEDLRRLGADGTLRPYASRIEPPPPDVATSHETYDAGATRGTVSDV